VLIASGNTSIRFQGLPCLSFSGTRTPGIDPDFYSVTMLKRVLEETTVKGLAGLFGSAASASGSAGTVPRGDGEASVPSGGERLGDSVLVRGDVEIDHAGSRTVLAGLFLRQDAIEQLTDTDGEAVVRVNLVDLRGLWRGRGELWGALNLRQHDGSLIPRSTDSGKPHSVRSALGKVLRALPFVGQPIFDGDTEARLRAIEAPPTTWAGLQAVEVLGDMIQEHGLALHLALDSTVVIADARAAPTPAGAGNAAQRSLVEAGTARSVALPAFSYRFRGETAVSYKPGFVRVKHGATIRDDVTPLVPVGLDRVTGRIVPLEDACASWGVDIPSLARWVALPEDDRERAFNGFAAGRVDDVASWAMRLWQIPPSLFNRLPLETRLASASREREEEKDQGFIDPGEAPEKLVFGVASPTAPWVEVESFAVAVVSVSAEGRRQIEALRERANAQFEAARVRMETAVAELGPPPWIQARRDERAQIIRDYEAAFERARDDRDSAIARVERLERSESVLPDPARIDAAVKNMSELQGKLRNAGVTLITNGPVKNERFTFDPVRGLIRFDRPVGYAIPVETLQPSAVGEVALWWRQSMTPVPAGLRSQEPYRPQNVPLLGNNKPIESKVDPLELKPTRLVPSAFVKPGQPLAIVPIRATLHYAWKETPRVAVSERENPAASVSASAAGLLFVDSGDGVPKLVNLPERKPPVFRDPPGVGNVYPKLVSGETDKLYVSEDGSSNIDELVERAEKLARETFAPPAFSAGGTGETPTIVPIGTGALVRRVDWQIDGDGARTRWTEGFEPIRNLAKGALRQRERTIPRTEE